MRGLLHSNFIGPALAVIALLLLVSSSLYPLLAQENTEPRTCGRENLYCGTEKLAVGTEALRTLPAVSVDAPASPGGRTVTYAVETRGNIVASLAEFKTQAQQTLNDERGWARMGVQFREAAGGGDFTLVLSEAAQVPSFAPGGCDSQYSCNVGRYVIINQDRWLGATPSWNSAGGNLRDYRHMVINHETGHWLGHGHSSCSGAGQPATVMQQQSINLLGCTFNPWPLESELSAPALGIQ